MTFQHRVAQRSSPILAMAGTGSLGYRSVRLTEADFVLVTEHLGLLSNLQQQPVKIGGRLAKQARYHWLLLREGHSKPSWLFLVKDLTGWVQVDQSSRVTDW